MPVEKIVSQFNKGDLFAVLSPGFVIFTFVYAVYRTDKTTASLWAVLQVLAEQLQQRPAWIVFVLFAAYLLGSLLRAVPVWWAERLSPPFRMSRFPYPDVLKEVVATVKNHYKAAGLDETRLPDLGDGVPMHIYNYWKNALCLGTASGFDYYQTFEMRVRFFTGMIWAGWIGLLCSLAVFIHCWAATHVVGWTMLLLALLLLLTFGVNFRRVRRQESRALLLLFITYLQQQQSPSPSNQHSA